MLRSILKCAKRTRLDSTSNWIWRLCVLQPQCSWSIGRGDRWGLITSGTWRALTRRRFVVHSDTEIQNPDRRINSVFFASHLIESWSDVLSEEWKHLIMLNFVCVLCRKKIRFGLMILNSNTALSHCIVARTLTLLCFHVQSPYCHFYLFILFLLFAVAFNVHLFRE